MRRCIYMVIAQKTIKSSDQKTDFKTLVPYSFVIKVYKDM